MWYFNRNLSVCSPLENQTFSESLFVFLLLGALTDADVLFVARETWCEYDVFSVTFRECV